MHAGDHNVSVVPFGHSAAEAKKSIETWGKGQWFAPDFVPLMQKEGVHATYVPFWSIHYSTTCYYEVRKERERERDRELILIRTQIGYARIQRGQEEW